MTTAAIGQNADHLTNRPATRRRDIRRTAGVILVLLIVVSGGVVQLLPGSKSGAKVAESFASGAGFGGLRATSPTAEQPETTSSPVVNSGRDDRRNSGTVRQLLDRAAQQNEARRYNDAIATLNQLRPLDPDNAEAYMRVGDALLGKRDYVTARDFYLAAVDRDPVLSGAYFGFAVASEALGDLESAIGGMRNYLHMEVDKAPGRLPVAQARSAIWEWESKLGRGPWGPTKGIPPGWTADEIKRDGRGVGVKMQKIETLRPDGTMDYEIKAGDRFPELWRK